MGSYQISFHCKYFWLSAFIFLAVISLEAWAGDVGITRSGAAISKCNNGVVGNAADSIWATEGGLIVSNPTKLTYSILVPNPNLNNNMINLRVCVYGKGDSGLFSYGEPTLYAGSNSLGDLSPNEKENSYTIPISYLRPPQANTDDIGYWLDITLDFGSADWYDIRDVRVEYSFPLIVQEDLESYQVILSASEALLNFYNCVTDANWANSVKSYDNVEKTLKSILPGYDSLACEAYPVYCAAKEVRKLVKFYQGLKGVFQDYFSFTSFDTKTHYFRFWREAQSAYYDMFLLVEQFRGSIDGNGQVDESEINAISAAISTVSSSLLVMESQLRTAGQEYRNVLNNGDQGVINCAKNALVLISPMLRFDPNNGFEQSGSYLPALRETLESMRPTSVPINHAPVLSNPRVSPMSGTEHETEFEFLVDYYDPDGDAPHTTYRKVYISGGRECTMTLKSGTPSSGTYEYATTLPQGSYSYNFLFADSKGASGLTSGQTGPNVYTNDSTVELKVQVNGGPVTNNIGIEFEYGPDLSNLESFEWIAPELPQCMGIDSGQQLMFSVTLKSNNHTFIKWQFRDDQGNLVRESTASGYGFTLLSGNLHATAIFNYTPNNYTISGTVLGSDGTTIPGGVDLTLTSSEQTLSQHTNNGNFSFSGVKGGVSVTITPSASGYGFAPSSRVYDNLRQDWSNESMSGDSSDDLAPTTSLSNTPLAVSENTSLSFTWTGQDNVSLPQNLQYQYKLVGYDADWSTLTGITNKIYDVNNGAYTFLVRAKDEAGNINQVPTTYSFVVNAAPKVITATRIANSVWASRITLQMPSSPMHPTQTFVLLPGYSGMADSELVPVTIHLPDSNIASGGNENIAPKLGIPTMIVKTETGWLVTLPQPLVQGQSVQYDIRWGKIKYFGWHDIVQIPQGFPNLTVGTDYSSSTEASFLDEQFRMWRQAHKDKRRSVGGWGSTKAWIYLDMADKNSSILSERLLEYLPGVPNNGSYACDYSGEKGQIIKLGNNICYAWTTEKYEKIGGSDYEDHRYQRYNIASFDTAGNQINTYNGGWQEDTSIRIPSSTTANGIYIVGDSINHSSNSKELWYTQHNSQGQLIQSRTVFESFAQTNSGSLYFWGVRECGANVVFPFNQKRVVFLFERSRTTSLRDDRQEIFYQVWDATGNLVKASTTINPPLQSDSVDEDDEYEIESAITDNTGKVWVSFSHRQTYDNYYMIIGSDGNIWKGNTFIGTDVWRNFHFCDKDGYIWATENSNLLILNSNDTQAFPPRTTAYIPNQNVGDVAVVRDWNGTNYRLYDRWSQQLLQVDIPEGISPSYMDLYDLNLWANDLHTSNTTIKKGNTIVWSQNGQLTGKATVDVSTVLNKGQNLLTMTQNDFMGGQVLVTFPYSVPGINGDFDFDGKVNFVDYAVLANRWQSDGCGELDWCDKADIDRSGSVGFEDIRIMAENWLQIFNYSLSVSVVNGNGNVNPSSGSYATGTVVQLTATPNSGYRVKTWHCTDNDSSTLSTNTVTMTSDKNVSVEFEVIPPDYGLDITYNGQSTSDLMIPIIGFQPQRLGVMIKNGVSVDWITVRIVCSYPGWLGAIPTLCTNFEYGPEIVNIDETQIYIEAFNSLPVVGPLIIIDNLSWENPSIQAGQPVKIDLVSDEGGCFINGQEIPPGTILDTVNLIWI